MSHLMVWCFVVMGSALIFLFAVLKMEKREKNLLLFNLLTLLWSACCFFCANIWSCNIFCILITWLEVYARCIRAIEPRQESGQMCWRVSAQMVDSSEHPMLEMILTPQRLVDEAGASTLERVFEKRVFVRLILYIIFSQILFSAL